MTIKDILYNEVIAKDETFKNIKFNSKTNKIELNGENFLGIYYTDILDKANELWPGTKFTMTLVKQVVEKWAHDNTYKPEEPHYEDWYKKLDINVDKGTPEKTLNNLITFFTYYPEYVNKFNYNDFTKYENFENTMIEEHMIVDFRKVAEKVLGYEYVEKTTAAILYVCHQNTFNPFKDAIENLVWDGVERAETLFIKFIGAEDTPLNRIMTKKWLYAMIKRLYEPGCDFDNMLITYDATQGTGKTKIVKRLVECLGVGYGYDTSITYSDDKDNVDKLNKTWIVAIDELTNFLKVEPEKAKQFVCKNSDTARLSYDRRSKQFDRHCVFYGSTNVELFLKDYSSNYERRYWIMDCNGEPHSGEWWEENLPDEYLQQVIAEMYYFYKNNPNFNYKTLTIEETKMLTEIQMRHKTINNEDILLEELDVLLNRQLYEKNNFNSYSDFSVTISRGKTKEMVALENNVPEFIPFENSDWVYLDKLPVAYIKKWVKDELKREIQSTQYVTSLMSILGWKYKKIRIGDRIENGYKKDDEL